MKPGRDLDTLIAEKVFGKTRHKARKGGPLLECARCGEAFQFHWTVEQVESRLCGVTEVEPYSTSLPAAWDLVEAVRSKMGTRFFTHTIEDDCSRAGFGGTEMVRGETPAHAICLSALRFLEDCSHDQYAQRIGMAGDSLVSSHFHCLRCGAEVIPEGTRSLS